MTIKNDYAICRYPTSYGYERKATTRTNGRRAKTIEYEDVYDLPENSYHSHKPAYKLILPKVYKYRI